MMQPQRIRIAKQVQRVRDGRVQTYIQHYYIRTQPLDYIERALLGESRRLEQYLKSLIEQPSTTQETANPFAEYGLYTFLTLNVDAPPIVETTDDKRFERVRAHAVDYLTRIHQFAQRFPAQAAQIVDTRCGAVLTMLTLLGDQPAEFWAHYGATDAIDFYLRFEQRGKEIPARHSRRKWVFPFLLNAVRPVPATPDTLERWRTPLAQHIMETIQRRAHEPIPENTITQQIWNASEEYKELIKHIQDDQHDSSHSIQIVIPSQQTVSSLVLARYGTQEKAYWNNPLKRLYGSAMADVIDSIYRDFYETRPPSLKYVNKLFGTVASRYDFDGNPFLAQEYRRRREANPELYQWAEETIFENPY